MARRAVYGTYCCTCLRSVRLHTVASLERSAAKACSRGCAVNCERKLSMSPNTRSSIMLTSPYSSSSEFCSGVAVSSTFEWTCASASFSVLAMTLLVL